MVSELVGGWDLPLWKMMEFVSWDDDIPNISQYWILDLEKLELYGGLDDGFAWI